jgi:hypothetical protein
VTRERTRPLNKRRRKKGRERTDRKLYPYEPKVVGGKLMLPAELQRIHGIVLNAGEVEIVPDEIRAVVETLWPELAHKLAPRS